MKLTKTKPSKWNGVDFGTSTAGGTIVGHTDWYVTSRGGDWFAINLKTGQCVTGYKRDILAAKLKKFLA